MIEAHCHVPDTFFEAGGVAISNEYHDSKGDGYVRTRYYPIVSVSKLEYNKASLGSTQDWASLTEGQDKNFIVYKESGIIYVHTTVPSKGKQRVRVSYTAGFSAVPQDVKFACVDLVCNMIDSIIARKLGSIGRLDRVSFGQVRQVEDEVFTPAIKARLRKYVVVRVEGA